MQNSLGRKILFLFLLLGITLVPSKAEALIIIDGNGPLGSFSGTFRYQALNSTTANLEIYLKNTSPVVNGGYITALAFNNPSNLITGITLSATDSDFTLIGGPVYQNSVNGASNGQFDIGISTGGGYTGGGAPSAGIATGADETFIWALTGTNLTTLTEEAFVGELSEGTGSGSGYKSMVIRFRGFNNDGSDKVPASFITQTPVPEPATILLLGSGLVGMMLRRKR